MAVKFDAGFGQGKLPANGSLSGAALGHAGGDVGGEFVQGGEALMQTMAGDG
jgi:hypothetical protein